MVVKKKNKFVYEATSYMDNLKEEELSSYALEIEHIIDKAHNQGISDGLTLKVIEILKKIPNRISTFSKKEFLSIFDDAMKRQIKKLQMIKGFKDSVRKISLDRLGKYTKIKGLKNRDFFIGEPTADQNVGKKLTFVMAESSSLRFNFQAYFTHDIANKFLIGEKLEEVEEPLNSPDDVVDFMKEFCNLTAGGIKMILAKGHDKLSNLSLPMLTRAQDSIFLMVDSTTDSIRLIEDSWDICFKNFSITCKITIEIYDQESFFELLENAEYGEEFEDLIFKL
tara:strand:+ start:569 stop:1411 length:843 start_codon:yes stop_codon:yes gene_type:complete